MLVRFCYFTTFISMIRIKNDFVYIETDNYGHVLKLCYILAVVSCCDGISSLHTISLPTLSLLKKVGRHFEKTRASEMRNHLYSTSQRLAIKIKKFCSLSRTSIPSSWSKFTVNTFVPIMHFSLKSHYCLIY